MSYCYREWIIGTHFNADLLVPEIRRLRNYGCDKRRRLDLSVLAAAAIVGFTANLIRRLAEGAQRAHA